MFGLTIAYSLKAEHNSNSFIKMDSNSFYYNLPTCLYSISKNNDARFSIETVFDTSKTKSIMTIRVDQSKLKSAEMNDFLKNIELKDGYKFSIIENNTHNMRYHIIDSSVMNMDKYVLDDVVKVFKFVGTPVEMLKELKKEFPRLCSMISSARAINDISTIVNVNVKNVTLRELFTDVVTSLDYNSVEWVAYTDLETMNTCVCFSGMKRYPTPETTPEAKQVINKRNNLQNWPFKVPEDQSLWEEIPTATPSIWPTITPCANRSW